MKSTMFKAVITAALLSMSVMAAQAQEQIKIGYVNGERVMRESNLAKAAQAKLEAEFGKREKELTEMDQRRRGMAEKLEKDAATLSDAQRKARQREFDDLNVDFQRKGQAYQEDLNRRKNEELQNINERANRVIKQIFDADKYDLIIQDVAFVSPRVDITKKVIDALNAQK
ncbi:MAG: OmpH family outer membrane protein [Paucibacter sp.]|nr:OmpH family outer membrane protein [Roseateles sp.]